MPARRPSRASFLPLVAAALLASPTLAAPAAAPRDAALWKAAEAARPEQLKLLEQLVNIDSGTGDVEGGRKIADIIRPRLEALGGKVRLSPAEAPNLPDNLVATFEGKGQARILMIAHMDTVFGPGTVAKRPFKIDGQRATGPGVADEKGGVVEGLYALKLLHDRGFTGFKSITFLIETSEERGSPGSRKLIGELLKDADVELNLEPGDDPDMLTVWRKGSATYHIKVKGRAAHAGVAPQDGRNAIVELMHQLSADDVFPKSGDGLTANVTVINGGARNNIIPEAAEAQINVRVREPGDFDRVQQTYEANAAKTQVPDTQVHIEREPAYPPLPSNPATEALADHATSIYAGLGMKLGRTGNGGASESALAAQAKVPALDGLGPVGGGFHSDGEYMELGTVTPRLYLLAKLLMDLGPRPPAPMK